MMMECPTTALFNTWKTRFSRGLEKMGALSEASCQMSCFTGRMSEKILKRFEKDHKSRDEIKRGITKKLSIMFADIRGFTTRTSMMHPERIVQLLDLFIPEMINIIIERHKGMVDKLLGDGIMALYGHPYATGEEIIQAVHSAIDMQQAASAMETVLRLSGYDPIEIGVGINFGEVLICEVGNDTYRESTIIGAPVNMAAKMEDVAEAHQIVMPDDVLSEIEKLRPRMLDYFSGIGERHGVKAVALDWAGYIGDGEHGVGDWEVR